MELHLQGHIGLTAKKMVVLEQNNAIRQQPHVGVSTQ